MEISLKIFRYQPNRKIQLSTIIWFAFAAIAVILEILRGKINNYLIYKYVFWHTLHQTNLYTYYPGEYVDLNHYGPLFSLIILPFAMLPDWLGVLLWALANAGVLFYAINRLPVSDKSKNLILLISSIEMMTSIHNVQFNPMLTGWLILIFISIHKDKTFLAGILTIAGFLIKIYGLAGIAFFPFSKNKMRFTGYLIFWLLVLFCLPMIISSPSYILQTYLDWFHALVDKNAANVQLTSFGIDISVMGLIRRIFSLHDMPNYFVLIPASIAILAPLLRFSQYADNRFQLNYLAFILISIVIFSSSAESPTYIIAVTGVAIWYCQINIEKKSPETYVLLLVLILTSLSSTDLFPRSIREHWVKPYSLKALPCFIVWIIILLQLLLIKSEDLPKTSEL